MRRELIKFALLLTEIRRALFQNPKITNMSMCSIRVKKMALAFI